MAITSLGYDQPARFIYRSGTNFQKVWIVPQQLGFAKINAVLVAVRSTLPWVEFKLIHEL
jgi:hypothetical protein